MISVGRKRRGSCDHACDALSSTGAESVFPLLFKKVRLVVLDHACDTLFSTVAQASCVVLCFAVRGKLVLRGRLVVW